jgi:hypothetical protein
MAFRFVLQAIKFPTQTFLLLLPRILERDREGGEIRRGIRN